MNADSYALGYLRSLLKDHLDTDTIEELFNEAEEAAQRCAERMEKR
ncbi:hypothetical protein I6J72_05375 [Corynebacterium sp. FDAARGOS 1242]|nr:hypothetical protein [Corynebacterium sp. FDAARGOS 1242]QRP98931.1 hypothetical protein I6J72_05375 [Corynebacterium sp. FDAARGOS 1242]